MGRKDKADGDGGRAAEVLKFRETEKKIRVEGITVSRTIEIPP